MRAAISPDTPDRWDFNSAMYTDWQSFARALPMLDEAFSGAGVGGWAVRVPGDQRDVAPLLAAEGFAPEAHGYAVGRELDQRIVAPEPVEPIAIRRDWDLETAGRINDLAHGDRPGEWFRALGAIDPTELLLYTAHVRGEPASALLVFDRGDDTVHWYLATLASARAHGLGRLLKLTALAEAQDRGCTTSTSHTTANGARLAMSCGYRRLAAVTAWVRRLDPDRGRSSPRAARVPARAGGR